MIKQVFLADNNSGKSWADSFAAGLSEEVKYYIPASPEDFLVEKDSYYTLYLLTPENFELSVLARMVESSIKKPRRTLCCLFFPKDEHPCALFRHQDIIETIKLIRRNGGITFTDYDQAYEFLVSKLAENENEGQH